MNRYYVLGNGLEAFEQGLADREKQWKTGFSARSLAYCWHEAKGFPEPVGEMFKQSLGETELLMGFPEYKVALPGGGRPSQNDIFVLARSPQGLVTMMVEGKVAEPFDKSVAEWLVEASAGKQERLAFLCDRLGLEPAAVQGVRYQLLHRTVSALLEAERFGARAAVMLVHSFSPSHAWFADYAAFAALFGLDVALDRLYLAGEFGGIKLYLGWAHGDEAYLKR